MASTTKITSAKADETYDLSGFISAGATDETTYYNYSILSYLNGFEYAITNLLYDYADEFEDYSHHVRLSDLDFYKYRYKPSLLAFDVYGSVEAGFIVMMLNGIISDKEFDFKRVKLVKTSDLVEILGRIYSANQTYLNNMASDLKDDKKADATGNTVW